MLDIYRIHNDMTDLNFIKQYTLIVISAIVFCLISNACFAQIPINPNKIDRKGMRQKKWTILYDASWKEIGDTSSVAFYRVITYKNDKPLGKVIDYYRDGTAQMEAYLLADRPTTVYDGECSWYRADGSKQTVRYFENGDLKRELFFDREGIEQDYDLENELRKARLHYNNKQYDSALIILKKYYQEFHNYYDEDPKGLRGFYITLGNSYYRNGDTTLYKLVRVDVKKLNKEIAKLGTWEHLTDQGFVAVNNGEFEKGIKILRNASTMAEEKYGADHLEYATSLSYLGTAYFRKGDIVKAEQLYNDAIIVFQKSLVYRNTDYATCQSNLAGIQLSLGNLSKAEKGFRAALKVYRKKSSLRFEQRQSFTAVLSNVALVTMMRQGATEEVKNLIKEAHEVAKDDYEYHYEKNLEYYLSSLMNMARYHSVKKEFQVSDSLNNYLLELIKEKNIVGSYPRLILNNLASSAMARKDYVKAENYLKQSIEEAVHNGDYVTSTIPLFNLAFLYYENNRLEKAAPLFEAVVDSAFKQIKYVLPSLAESERAPFIAMLNQSFSIYYSYGAKAYKENPEISASLFEVALKQKGIIFRSWQKMQQRIIKSGDQALINDYKRWQDMRKRLAKVYYLSDKERDDTEVDLALLEKEINLVEKNLSLRSEAFKKNAIQQDYRWQDLQKVLKPNEALVDILRIGNVNVSEDVKYIAFVITSQTKGAPEIIELHEGADMEGKYFNHYSNAIKLQAEDQRSYGYFWSKIASSLDGIKKVYLSPDGVYHKVNMTTLRNTSTASFLGEELEVVRLSSSINLPSHKKKRKSKKFKNQNLYLFGYPDYKLYQKNDINPGSEPKAIQPISTDSLKRFFDPNGSVKLLPGTKKEVELISNIAGKRKLMNYVYLENEASEEKIKSLQNPSILHIATHGFFLNNRRRNSFLDLDNQLLNDNPLLRSGLLLAGAESRLKGNINYGEDGILTALEAKNLALDQTDLVVLSACETGLGTIGNGEGVYGLQRAFQQAGAKSVIMSLWNVSDKATQEFMTLFYQNYLTEKMNKREAFNNAQKSIRKKYPSPYYWGAFVIVGD